MFMCLYKKQMADILLTHSNIIDQNQKPFTDWVHGQIGQNTYIKQK